MFVDLDVKDRKLIYLLDFDARMPLTKIAKKLGISKQVAKYRLDRLLKRNIVTGFYADINASKLNQSIFLVYFKFQHFTPEIEKDFVSHISIQPHVGVNTSINGKWDYCIGIWAKNVIHFKTIYANIMKQFEQYVVSKTTTIETDFFYFKPKQIWDGDVDKQIEMSGDLEDYSIDKIDEIILSNLAKDARISLIELSKLTGFTANGVKERIKKLNKNNVILGFRTMINYQLLGFLHYRVFLHLENLTEENERKIIYFLKQQKSIVSVTKTIGYCELEFRSILKDIHEFYSFMELFRSKFQNLVKDYESILYYKFHDVLNYFPYEV